MSLNGFESILEIDDFKMYLLFFMILVALSVIVATDLDEVRFRTSPQFLHLTKLKLFIFRSTLHMYM